MNDDFIKKEILRNMINNNSSNITISVIGNSAQGMSYSSLLNSKFMNEYLNRKNCEVIKV